jgi:hypothetical protein
MSKNIILVIIYHRHKRLNQTCNNYLDAKVEDKSHQQCEVVVVVVVGCLFGL